MNTQLNIITPNQERLEKYEHRRKARVAIINEAVLKHSREIAESDPFADEACSLRHIMEWIASDFSSLNAEMRGWILPEANLMSAQAGYSGLKENKKMLAEEHVAAKKDRLNKKRVHEVYEEADDIDEQELRMDHAKYYALLGCEWMYNGFALQGIGDSLIAGFVTAAALTYSLVKYAVLAERYVARATTEMGRKIRFWQTVIPLLMLFCGLGYLRYLYFGQGSAMQEQFGSIVIPTFVLINMLLYVGLYYMHSQLPSKEAVKVHNRAMASQAEFLQAKGHEKECGDAIREHNVKAPGEIASRLENIEYFNAALDSNYADFQSSMALWKREVIRWLHRVPSVFDQDTTPLIYKHFSVKDEVKKQSTNH